MSVDTYHTYVDCPELYYRLYQMVFSTNLQMKRLTFLEEQHPEIRFRVGKSINQRFTSAPFKWYHQYFHRSDGTPWLSCARRAEGYLLREHTVGDFLVSQNGGDILCLPLPDTSPEMIQDTFLYPILPLVLNLRGLDGFHAATVKIGQKAVAFAGESSVGKSTLAAYLHSLGCPLLTDEYLIIDEYEKELIVRPGLPEIRLWPSSIKHLEELFSSIERDNRDAVLFSSRSVRPNGDENKSKMIFELKQESSSSDRIPLDRIYFLVRPEHTDADNFDEGSGPTYFGSADRKCCGSADPQRASCPIPAREVEIETLSGTKAFLKLMDQSYRLDLADQGMLQRQMNLFARIISEERVKLLKLAWGYELLPKAADLILRLHSG